MGQLKLNRYKFEILFTVFLFSLFLFSSYAFAHSWYDPECCNDKDCVPVEKIEKIAGVNGDYWYFIRTPGVINKLFPVRVTREDIQNKSRFSQDQKYHICGDFYELNDKEEYHVKCIYVPGAV